MPWIISECWPVQSLHSYALTILTSFAASSQLVKQVTTELKLEQKPIEDLSTGFTSFELTLDGALATLVRDHNQEKVKVQLDANSAVEAANDDVTEFDEDEGAATDDESDVW